MSGYPCPICNSSEAGVTDSRSNKYGIRRRRKCPNGHRFTTQEMVGDINELKRLISKENVLDLRDLSTATRAAFKTLFKEISDGSN